MNKIAVLWPNQIPNHGKILTPGVYIYENVGVLNSPAIASRLEQEGFQAIVCTGGIEDAVKQVTGLPMYVVTSGYIDILESFRRLENEYGIIGKRVALLVHENNSIQLSRIQPFLRNTIRKFTFSDQKSVWEVQKRIVSSGYDAIMTGPTGLAVARESRIEIPAYSLIYSEESFLDAVEQMNRILDMSRKEVLRSKQVQAAIDASPYAIVATDEAGNITLCNQKAVSIVSGSLESIMNRPVTTVFKDTSWHQVYAEGVVQQEVLMKIGNTDYFSTRIPIIQNNQIIGSVGTLQEVEQIRTMESKFRSLQARGLTAKYQFDNILYKSPRMRQVVEQAKIYAETNLTVLIEGETGTGKEMIAQSIHNASYRRNGPFVAINCAALAESLLESELMGYEEGAFTGAKKGGKIGLFELAHNGTLFLDEINQLPPLLQSKLLRVIQERTIMRIGGSRMIPVNVRIIAASNESLKKKVRAGLFRSDLYYRINILYLRLPALRDRKEDINLLIEKFAREKGAGESMIRSLCQEVSGYDWPGNIRELENYVWRSTVLNRKGISLDSDALQEYMPDDGDMGEEDADSSAIRLHIDTLARMEKEIVTKVVRRMNGNQSQAAKVLGVSRNTISSKLR
ncbi:sigma 54-interacting transcriptional regulator [Dysosmobacter sp.]|uniref:sigma 54-interacting transcriptional regulator n=1 Tax=Dysosmobacter sp. TaxID=2591382 RepID=UPI002A8D4A37|nr:sigma 54-interacting transcriptional regulator [Dysosmobacter sp.]MDY3282590.1 sigma 54-interacting transcriptional regulator [Dysosmobacter sp.]